MLPAVSHTGWNWSPPALLFRTAIHAIPPPQRDSSALCLAGCLLWSSCGDLCGNGVEKRTTLRQEIWKSHPTPTNGSLREPSPSMAPHISKGTGPHKQTTRVRNQRTHAFNIVLMTHPLLRRRNKNNSRPVARPPENKGTPFPARAGKLCHACTGPGGPPGKGEKHGVRWTVPRSRTPHTNGGRMDRPVHDDAEPNPAVGAPGSPGQRADLLARLRTGISVSVVGVTVAKFTWTKVPTPSPRAAS